MVRDVFLHLAIGVRNLLPPLSSSVSTSYLPAIIQSSARRMLNKSASLNMPSIRKEDHVLHHVVALDFVIKTQARFV